MKITLVAGARPNFVKVAPMIWAIDRHNAGERHPIIDRRLVHTGQHYDYEMSRVFFEDLEIPEPDTHLGVGSGTHAEQTGRTMIEIENVLLKERPDLVVVVGDVNATLAGALAAVKLRIPVAHVEAGLRSFDLDMPEEINRLLTDAISDYLFTPSADADENLRREGVPDSKIFLVGNIMVDSLLHSREMANKVTILSKLGLAPQSYALMTLHRPSNVDEKESLAGIVQAVREVSSRIPVVFPAHPRTQKKLKEFGLLPQSPVTSHQSLIITDPLGYLDFVNLEMNARMVMTDSGGMQEETTVLGIPCLTLRDTTERPVTVREGTNVLVGNDPQKIVAEAFKILDGSGKRGTRPRFWDGKTAERILDVLIAGRNA